MKRQTLVIEMNQDRAPSDDVDPTVLRERISNLRELVDDLRQRAEDVTCTLEGFGLVGLSTTLPTGAHELDFYSEVRRFEIFLIRNALRSAKGSQVKAARLLKMHETTLNSKLKSFNIDHRDYSIAFDGPGS
jgi:transcriptional regulator with GAF, ATPase, and Fis domain